MDSEAVTNPDNFLSRTFHTSIVLGNYLYIDGGQVAYTSNGQNYSLPANSTYSVDLSVAWTYQNVKVNRINKEHAPSLNTGNLWLDRSGSFFYSYNGDVGWLLPLSEQQAPPPSQLYRFTPDGSGGGAWEQVSAVSIDRVTAAAGTYGNGFGYAVGGWKTSHTSSTGLSESPVRAPGVVTYNMQTGSWSNISDTTTNQFAYVAEGVAHLIPELGQNGLLLVMGGATSEDGENGRYVLNSFENITLYDPASNTVAFQTTSGSIPVGRTHTCSVMTKGDNSTYEIFVYNGDATDPNTGEYSPNPSDQNKALDAVYALSLPSFKWFKANTSGSFSRWGHTCNVAGENGRQMLSIGGAPVANTESLLQRDYLPQGIAIFDLTRMAWSSNYDPNLKEYTTPQPIIDDYNVNGWTTPRTGWSSQQVEQWFTSGNSSNTSSTNPSSTNSPSSSNPSSPPSSSHTGAIAGGVVGGIAAIALLALLVWFFFFRGRRGKITPPAASEMAPSDAKSELHAANKAQPPTYAEMNGHAHPHVELSAGSQGYSHGQGEDQNQSQVWRPVYELGSEGGGGGRK